MSDFIDDTSNATSRINEVAYQLSELAISFRHTGNEAMYDQLYFLSDDLAKSAKIVSDAVGVEINDRLQSSQQATSNIVLACLATTEMAREDKP